MFPRCFVFPPILTSPPTHPPTHPRYTPSMLEHPALNGSRTIDDLYLDNTYCDRNCRFPSRVSVFDTSTMLGEVLQVC